jgi:hypothetical protein
VAAAHFAVDLWSAPRLRGSRWGFLLLLAGLLLAAWTAMQWQQGQTRRDAEAEVVARLEAALAQRGAASRAASARVPSAAERRLQAELARLSADLFRPWFPLLDALASSSGPKVNLQQLGVDAAFTKLQLRVDAADLPEVLQYVQSLDRAGAPLQGAQLLGHEWVGGAGQPRRLSARISAGLSGTAVAGAMTPRVVGSCAAETGVPCLSAKVTP